jgi:hypothetical protein
MCQVSYEIMAAGFLAVEDFSEFSEQKNFKELIFCNPITKLISKYEDEELVTASSSFLKTMNKTNRHSVL